MFSVFEITKSLLLEVSIYKKALNVSELSEETLELLVVVLLDIADLLAHTTQFGYLVFDLVLELGHFARQIAHVQFVKHNHIMLSVLTQQTLKANRTEIVLAESLYIFGCVDFALLAICGL